MAKTDAQVIEANHTFEDMVDSVRAISAAGEKIAGVMEIIDEIALQTSILALNSAVGLADAREIESASSTMTEQSEDMDAVTCELIGVARR